MARAWPTVFLWTICLLLICPSIAFTPISSLQLQHHLRPHPVSLLPPHFIRSCSRVVCHATVEELELQLRQVQLQLQTLKAESGISTAPTAAVNSANLASLLVSKIGLLATNKPQSGGLPKLVQNTVILLVAATGIPAIFIIKGYTAEFATLSAAGIAALAATSETQARKAVAKGKAASARAMAAAANAEASTAMAENAAAVVPAAAAVAAACQVFAVIAAETLVATPAYFVLAPALGAGASCVAGLAFVQARQATREARRGADFNQPLTRTLTLRTITKAVVASILPAALAALFLPLSLGGKAEAAAAVAAACTAGQAAAAERQVSEAAKAAAFRANTAARSESAASFGESAAAKSPLGAAGAAFGPPLAIVLASVVSPLSAALAPLLSVGFGLVATEGAARAQVQASVAELEANGGKIDSESVMESARLVAEEAQLVIDFFRPFTDIAARAQAWALQQRNELELAEVRLGLARLESERLQAKAEFKRAQRVLNEAEMRVGQTSFWNIFSSPIGVAAGAVFELTGEWVTEAGEALSSARVVGDGGRMETGSAGAPDMTSASLYLTSIGLGLREREQARKDRLQEAAGEDASNRGVFGLSAFWRFVKRLITTVAVGLIKWCQARLRNIWE